MGFDSNHKRLPFVSIGGIPVLDSGNSLLVLDTGSPVSFARSGVVSIDTDCVDVPTRTEVVDCDELSEFLGLRVDGLIGADQLREHDLHLCLQEKWAVFTQSNPETPNNPILVETPSGLPVVRCVISNAQRRLVVDTGAKVSYLRSDLANESSPLGPLTDFYPGVGSFRTQQVSLNAQIAEAPASPQAFGIAPSAVERVLGAANLDGIVGMSWLGDWASLRLSCQNGWMVLSDRSDDRT